jgi:hypothetical protein
MEMRCVFLKQKLDIYNINLGIFALYSSRTSGQSKQNDKEGTRTKTDFALFYFKLGLNTYFLQ